MTDDDLTDRVEELEREVDRVDTYAQTVSRGRSTNSNRLDEVEDTLDTIMDRLAKLERVVDPDPGKTAYDQLTKGQKVQKVRTSLVEEAARTNGKAALKYKPVMMLFDGHPSPGHTYDLMERAAQLDGFAYDESRDGEKRIRVKLDAVNDDTLVRAANNVTTKARG